MNYPVFAAHYLPPIPYFQLLAQLGNSFEIEQHEHFPKQTFRSRCTIYGANGALNLVVPVKKGKIVHTKMKDVRISYEEDWQRLHWMSLQSAYRSSAYFEFYEDDFAPFYEKKYEYLLDFNVAQLDFLTKILKMPTSHVKTEKYVESYGDLDFRENIHPKKPFPVHRHPEYYQVFEDKHGFLPNLSIVDLIFNKGPQSMEILLAK